MGRKSGLGLLLLACALATTACGEGPCDAGCADTTENFELNHLVYDSERGVLIAIGYCRLSACVCHMDDLPNMVTAVTLDPAASTFEVSQDETTWSPENYWEALEHFGLDPNRVQPVISSARISDMSCAECLIEAQAPEGLLVRLLTGKAAMYRPLRLQLLANDELRLDLILSYRDVEPANDL